MHVIGVDSCKGGWVSIAWDVEAKTLAAAVHSTFADLLRDYADAAAIGVDIPIGLSESGPRHCDIEARKVLIGRRSSVFPTPHPGVLDVPTYKEALACSRVLTGKGISLQTFAICDKIAEVNRALTPKIQSRVFEVHPEVSFWALAGGHPMVYPKRKSVGYEERRAMLVTALEGVAIPPRREAGQWAPPVNAHDILDAIAAAWTASRFVSGQACRLPAEPLTDACGLRMEIVYLGLENDS